jgi:hypothetical protein
MTGGNSVIRIKVYGIRDAAVPFAASLLVLLLCVNVGFTAFHYIAWLALLIWAAFTVYISDNLIRSRSIIIDHDGRAVVLGGRRLPFPDIKSIGRTEVTEYRDMVSFRRVKVKVTMRDGNVHIFPLSLTPSIADRVDGLIAELQKHAKATKKR